jgi:hypothetical protein
VNILNKQVGYPTRNGPSSGGGGGLEVGNWLTISRRKNQRVTKCYTVPRTNKLDK